MKKIKCCNMCGKELKEVQDDYLSVRKEWGYFSEKDQTVCRFHICETCFWRMLKTFTVPAEIYEQTETL